MSMCGKLNCIDAREFKNAIAGRDSYKRECERLEQEKERLEAENKKLDEQLKLAQVAAEILDEQLKLAQVAAEIQAGCFSVLVDRLQRIRARGFWARVMGRDS